MNIAAPMPTDIPTPEPTLNEPLKLTLLEEIQVFGAVKAPEPPKLTLIEGMKPDHIVYEKYTAAFTGVLSKLGRYSFKPPIRVLRDWPYMIRINRTTGATRLIPVVMPS